MFRGIEVSQQAIPRVEAFDGLPAISMPLHDLVDDAPPLAATYNPNDIEYAFSNDESAHYFDETRVRASTPEYRQASNRVAIVVGESALMSTLPLIPEETIIVVDQSEDMCSFMHDYVASLRTAETINDWGKAMGLIENDNHVHAYNQMRKGFVGQSGEWRNTGYSHALDNPDVYRQAHQLARQKAIIPWHADIADPHDMAALGKALRDRDAHVTFVNITNVPSVYAIPGDSAGWANRLDQLPMTSHAPILATANHPKEGIDPSDPNVTRITEALGPFFGTQNLRQYGGLSVGFVQGSLYSRQYRNAATEHMVDQFMKILGFEEEKPSKPVVAKELTVPQPDSDDEAGKLASTGFTIIEGDVSLTDSYDMPQELRKIIDELGT